MPTGSAALRLVRPASVFHSVMFKDETARRHVEPVAHTWQRCISCRITHIFLPHRDANAIAAFANPGFVDARGTVAELVEQRCNAAGAGQFKQGHPRGWRKVNLSRGMFGQSISGVYPLMILDFTTVDAHLVMICRCRKEPRCKSLRSTRWRCPVGKTRQNRLPALRYPPPPWFPELPLFGPRR